MSSECSSFSFSASLAMDASSPSAFFTAKDTAPRPSKMVRRSFWDEMLSPLRAKASRRRTTICDVYALVEATPISAPALMCTPQCVRLEIADPTVLVMPTQSAPRSRASSRLRRVSAVSPLCDRKMHVSFLKMGVGLSRRSDASSMDTGICTSFSRTGRQARPAL